MKRNLIVKCILCAVATFVVQCGRADIAPLYSGRVMTPIEWHVPLLRSSALVVLIPVVALLVLVFTICISRHKNNPHILARLACLAALLWGPLASLAYDATIFGVTTVSIWGVGIVSLIAALFSRPYLYTLKTVWLLCVVSALFFASLLCCKFIAAPLRLSETVKTQPNETYEEYVRRVRRDYLHYCPNCDIRLSHYYDEGYHWYCDRCNYGDRSRANGVQDQSVFRPDTVSGSADFQ